MADRQTWPQFNWNDLEASLRSLSLALYGSLDRSWHGLSTHKAEALACINQSSSQSGRQAGKQACQDLKKQAYTLRKPKEKKQSRAFSCLNWRGRKDDMDMDLMAGSLDGWMDVLATTKDSSSSSFGNDYDYKATSKQASRETRNKKAKCKKKKRRLTNSNSLLFYHWHNAYLPNKHL